MDGANCPACKGREVKVSKDLSIDRYPSVLVLNLMRFASKDASGQRTGITKVCSVLSHLSKKPKSCMLHLRLTHEAKCVFCV